MYGLRIECENLDDYRGRARKVWIMNSEFCVTSGIADESNLNNITIFETEEKAHEFMKTWTGHPWYLKPNGRYEIIPVKHKFDKCENKFQINNSTYEHLNNIFIENDKCNLILDMNNEDAEQLLKQLEIGSSEGFECIIGNEIIEILKKYLE